MQFFCKSIRLQFPFMNTLLCFLIFYVLILSTRSFASKGLASCFITISFHACILSLYVYIFTVGINKHLKIGVKGNILANLRFEVWPSFSLLWLWKLWFYV